MPVRLFAAARVQADESDPRAIKNSARAVEQAPAAAVTASLVLGLNSPLQRLCEAIPNHGPHPTGRKKI